MSSRTVEKHAARVLTKLGTPRKDVHTALPDSGGQPLGGTRLGGTRLERWILRATPPVGHIWPRRGRGGPGSRVRQ
ncbi:hypothetical protein OG734_27575 [Streptomyces sp. NBC_00576]|nr:hypothetical protein OG734_27575 [Streptomyces sp. NBC_00576]